MKIEVTPSSAFVSHDTPHGVRYSALCLSGSDALRVTLSSDKSLPVGKPVLLDGLYLPARRAGDLPRLFVR